MCSFAGCRAPASPHRVEGWLTWLLCSAHAALMARIGFEIVPAPSGGGLDANPPLRQSATRGGMCPPPGMEAA